MVIEIIGDIAQAAGTIIAAAIAAIALLNTNRYNISDKITRGQWAFETYILFAGARIRADDAECEKKYASFYHLFYAYTDEETKKMAQEIDEFIRKKENEKAQEKLYELIDWYYGTYRLARFSMKKKIGKGDQQKMIKQFDGEIEGSPDLEL